MTAPADAPPQTRLMLEIEYANLDELELMAVSNGRVPAAPAYRGNRTPGLSWPGRVESLGLTGDRFQFSQRPYQNNNYVFPIRLRAGQTVRYYFRLKQPHATLSFFARLWHRPAFLVSDRTEYFLWGIYIGLICMVLVLNMVMLVALRDWIYIWYSLYLHFIRCTCFPTRGLAFSIYGPRSRV